MKYRLIEPDGSLKQVVCHLNGVEEKALDTDGFIVDHDLPLLRSFKEKITAYRDKRFFIVGDYDCDGICATAIMKKLLNDLGIRVNYYIPSRSKEGYGLNEDILNRVYEHGFEVLICVDNGIKANDLLKQAADKGVICMVIDHHEYDILPDTDYVLHPDLLPEGYDDLCAAGLCGLLAGTFREDAVSDVYAGLATVADMVKVLGYNRYIIRKMMRILSDERIGPICSLLGKNSCTYENISYHVIPKINAISRLEQQMNVNYVVHFLLDDDSHGDEYLKKIEEINDRRKFLTRQMTATCKRIIDPDESFIIVSSKEFYEGICGLAANKLMFEYERPVLVLAEENGILKGSGRSPQGIDLYQLLNDHADLFLTFGGHANAVGISLTRQSLAELKGRLKGLDLHYELPQKEAILLRQDEFDTELVDQLDSLRPFGTGFREPLLAIKDPTIRKSFVISSGYPKYVLGDRLEAISFNSAHVGQSFSTMVGKLNRDAYRTDKLSFVIEDLL